MLVRLRLNAGDWRGLEPIQEPFEGVALEFRALSVPRAAADFVQKIARPTVDIIALEEVFVGSQRPA